MVTFPAKLDSVVTDAAGWKSYSSIFLEVGYGPPSGIELGSNAPSFVGSGKSAGNVEADPAICLAQASHSSCSGVSCWDWLLQCRSHSSTNSRSEPQNRQSSAALTRFARRVFLAAEMASACFRSFSCWRRMASCFWCSFQRRSDSMRCFSHSIFSFARRSWESKKYLRAAPTS